MKLSVAIITLNEECNIGRTLESVRALATEIVVVDCGSSDRTLEIARSFGAQVFVEEWKGYAAQKNSAMEKCTGEWILSLDADEAVSEELAGEISRLFVATGRPNAAAIVEDDSASGRARNESLQRGFDERKLNGFSLPRKNFFLGRWLRHGGFWPDCKVRLVQRGRGRFAERQVHETMRVEGDIGALDGALLHHAYPTLEGYITQMNRYSSLGANMAVAQRRRGFSMIDIILRPALTFLYNYVFRLGFLDGKEGLLLHLYHATYVSWKYAKAWEQSRQPARGQ